MHDSVSLARAGQFILPVPPSPVRFEDDSVHNHEQPKAYETAQKRHKDRVPAHTKDAFPATLVFPRPRDASAYSWPVSFYDAVG